MAKHRIVCDGCEPGTCNLEDEILRLRALNAELLAALKRVTGLLELHGEQRGEGAGDADACDVAHAAIAKAEEKA